MSDAVGAAAEIAAKLNGAARPKAGIELVPFRDLLEPDLINRGLVKGIINVGALVAIYGEPGCGKTFLTLDLALSVADGRSWFGHKVPKRGRVVYVAAEAGASIRNRVGAWAQEKWGDREIDFHLV